MIDKILKEIEQADAKDFVECLIENLRMTNKAQHYKMLLDIKYKDPAQWRILSKGCQAAADVFIALMEYSRI